MTEHGSFRLRTESKRLDVGGVVARGGGMGLPVWTWETLLPTGAWGWTGAGLRLLETRAVRGVVEAALSRHAVGEVGANEVPGGGAWVVVVPGVTGAVEMPGLAALAIGEAFESSPLFTAACAEAGIDAGRAREDMPGACRYTARSALSAGRALALFRADAAELSEASEALSAFSAELSDAYETISLLYNIGRSMHNPGRADAFAREFLGRLRGATRFGWMAMSLDDLPQVPSVLASGLIADGADVSGGFGRAVSIAASRARASKESVIIKGPGAPAEFGGGAVLAQPIEIAGRTVGSLVAGRKGGGDPDLSSYDLQLAESAARFLGSHLHTCALFEGQQRMFVGTVHALSAAIDAKDPYTNGHSERVAHLARQLARACGMSDEQADRVHIAGLLHDVGKIGVPEAVLCKQGRLTDEEFALIKRHPEIGHRILRDIPLLSDILPGVLHHHERWDGRGYPANLEAERVPMLGRLIAICDAFDAMSSTRSYRRAMPRGHVLGEIERSAGTQHDPSLVPLFLGLDLSEYDRMVARAMGQASSPPAAAA